jgi:hypothetical protein
MKALRKGGSQNMDFEGSFTSCQHVLVSRLGLRGEHTIPGLFEAPLWIVAGSEYCDLVSSVLQGNSSVYNQSLSTA